MNSFTAFLIITLLWFGPTLILALRMRQAQFRYIQRYKARFPESDIPDLAREPLFRMRITDVKTVGLLLRIYHEEQDEMGLESERRVVSRFHRLALGYGFGFPLVLFFVLFVFGQ